MTVERKGVALSGPQSTSGQPGFSLSDAAEPLANDKTTRRMWDRELRDAFEAHGWLFPRVEGGPADDGVYHARVFKRFQKDAVATIERVTAGWRLALTEANATMIFATAAGLAQWLFRQCGGQ